MAKKAQKKKSMSKASADGEAAAEPIDLDFKPPQRPNTTLSDWLAINNKKPVSLIEKMATYWHITFESA